MLIPSLNLLGALCPSSERADCAKSNVLLMRRANGRNVRPDLRELQASWRTMEQYGAQITLHFLKLLCEPRLGAAKLLRSLPKGARPGQRFQELTVHHVHCTVSI